MLEGLAFEGNFANIVDHNGKPGQIWRHCPTVNCVVPDLDPMLDEITNYRNNGFYVEVVEREDGWHIDAYRITYPMPEDSLIKVSYGGQEVATAFDDAKEALWKLVTGYSPGGLVTGQVQYVYASESEWVTPPPKTKKISCKSFEYKGGEPFSVQGWDGTGWWDEALEPTEVEVAQQQWQESLKPPQVETGIKVGAEVQCLLTKLGKKKIHTSSQDIIGKKMNGGK